MSEAIERRAVRALLFNADGYLLLIRRCRPGMEPYWTTPGGGIEPIDESPEAALERELFEELGATAKALKQVFLLTSVQRMRLRVQYFYVCRLETMTPEAASGTELRDPTRGSYDVAPVSPTTRGLAQIDLRPTPVKDFVVANRHALLDLVGL